MERDPVCGMNVEPEKAKAHAEFAGKRYFFCGAGCAKRFAESPERYLSAEAKPGMSLLPIVGETAKAKDPVCGMMVEPGKAAGRAEFEGERYYFCSARCAERFAGEPAKFLAAPGSAGMEAAAAGSAGEQAK